MAEDAPLFLTAPPPFGDGVRVTAVMERAVLEADGVDALVLRYGWFYGPGTYFGRDSSDGSRAGRAGDEDFGRHPADMAEVDRGRHQRGGRGGRTPAFLAALWALAFAAATAYWAADAGGRITRRAASGWGRR